MFVTNLENYFEKKKIIKYQYIKYYKNVLLCFTTFFGFDK